MRSIEITSPSPARLVTPAPRLPTPQDAAESTRVAARGSPRRACGLHRRRLGAFGYIESVPNDSAVCPRPHQQDETLGTIQ